MAKTLSEEELRKMAAQWLKPYQVPKCFRIHRDTSDFFQVDYDDVVILKGKPYLIRHNAKEGRFGLDDQVKFWVKRAIDLDDGSLKVMKLVFYERFMAHVGDIEFECFRSPKKEARILKLVAHHPGFMHGYSIQDEKENLIRIVDFIRGTPLYVYVGNMEMDHETYYHEQFPHILTHFMQCIRAIHFLHENGERHGDIRRDHILIDRETGLYRWIDFDFNYRHRENIYAYDLFGLGNILVYLVGMGDVLLRDLKRSGRLSNSKVNESDMNLVFNNRVVNLKKIYPYIPESLNRVLMHFSKGANRFYEYTKQLLDDLGEFKNAGLSQKP